MVPLQSCSCTCDEKTPPRRWERVMCTLYTVLPYSFADILKCSWSLHPSYSRKFENSHSSSHLESTAVIECRCEARNRPPNKVNIPGSTIWLSSIDVVPIGTQGGTGPTKFCRRCDENFVWKCCDLSHITKCNYVYPISQLSVDPLFSFTQSKTSLGPPQIVFLHNAPAIKNLSVFIPFVKRL